MSIAVGFGRVLVRLAIDGLTAAEWLNISQAVMRIKPPHGDMVEVVADIFPILQRIEATILFDKKGAWKIGTKVLFAGGDWVTSIGASDVVVSDGFA